MPRPLEHAFSPVSFTCHVFPPTAPTDAPPSGEHSYSIRSYTHIQETNCKVLSFISVNQNKSLPTHAAKSNELNTSFGLEEIRDRNIFMRRIDMSHLPFRGHERTRLLYQKCFDIILLPRSPSVEMLLKILITVELGFAFGNKSHREF